MSRIHDGGFVIAHCCTNEGKTFLREYQASLIRGEVRNSRVAIADAHSIVRVLNGKIDTTPVSPAARLSIRPARHGATSRTPV
jgi:hypothetical protein